LQHLSPADIITSKHHSNPSNVCRAADSFERLYGFDLLATLGTRR
jgi:hypothetical protein